jgi:mono/diheme cytochrome c family protein
MLLENRNFLCTVFALLSFSCQQSSKKEEAAACTPLQSPTYNDVYGIVSTSCSGCHDGTDAMRQNLMSESALRMNAQLSLTHLQNGTMPRAPKVIQACEKQNLMAYLQIAQGGGGGVLGTQCSTAIQNPSYYQVSNILQVNCATSGCHNGYTAGRQSFATEQNARSLASQALSRLQNNSMPPAPKVMNVCDKQNLVNYFTTLSGGGVGNSQTCSTAMARPTYMQIAQIVSTNCGSCHSGTQPGRQNLNSEMGLRNNKQLAMNYLQGVGQHMPSLPTQMNACDKQNLVNYLQTVY